MISNRETTWPNSKRVIDSPYFISKWDKEREEREAFLANSRTKGPYVKRTSLVGGSDGGGSGGEALGEDYVCCVLYRFLPETDTCEPYPTYVCTCGDEEPKIALIWAKDGWTTIGFGRHYGGGPCPEGWVTFPKGMIIPLAGWYQDDCEAPYLPPCDVCSIGWFECRSETHYIPPQVWCYLEEIC